VLDIIRDLRSAGKLGILIVVQELPIALAIADHICVMDRGSIVFDGSPQELTARPDIQARYIGVGV
jgi:branched-chain amino acid transport system ATP-binding protein